MNTPAIRRLTAATAVAGMAVMPLAACSAGSRTATRATPTEVWCQMHPQNVGCPGGPAPYTPTPKTSAATSAAPLAQQPNKSSGTGIPVWVWVLGGGAVVLVGYKFLQGGGGQAPAHATYGSAPVPQPVFDYDEYDDYDDEPGPVTPPAPPVAPAAPSTPPSGGGNSGNDLWGA